METRAEVSAAVPSPDGSHIAYLYELEPPGGVLADLYYYVSILPSSRGGVGWKDGEIVWKSKEVGPLYVLWTGERSLEVLLEPGMVVYDTIHTPSQTFSVTTRQLRSTLKSEIAGDGQSIPTRP